MMRGLELVVRLALAVVLAGAALSKLAAPRSSRAALATFGLRRAGVRQAAWAAVVVSELALAGGVALGFDAAALLAAGLLVVFAVVLGIALLRGRGGAPCACFGSRSRVGRVAVARTLLLAVAFAAVPWLPAGDLGLEGWLVAGLVVALAGVAALAVAVLALAREVGLLRLQLGPQAALELTHEGPPLGEPSPLGERFAGESAHELALAVFTSEGCRLCHALEPAIESLARDPLVALAVLDERRDAELWRELAIPGSPFAVALDRDGVVRAKGTFNNLAQLEGVLAAAERRVSVRG